jgi:hypothetical protein
MARPTPERRTQFRHLLDRHASGEHLQPCDYDTLSFRSDKIVPEFAQMVDAIFMTPDVIS